MPQDSRNLPIIAVRDSIGRKSEVSDIVTQ
jgi:hypothetical protein